MPKEYCTMNKEFFENKENCSGQTVSREEVIKEMESKSPEEVKAEIKEMLDEISGVMSFVRDRFTEITDKHKAFSCAGALGYISAVSFSGKPVAFTGVGTKKALDNAFKVVMAGMISHED